MARRAAPAHSASPRHEQREASASSRFDGRELSHGCLDERQVAPLKGVTEPLGARALDSTRPTFSSRAITGLLWKVDSVADLSDWSAEERSLTRASIHLEQT